MNWIITIPALGVIAAFCTTGILYYSFRTAKKNLSEIRKNRESQTLLTIFRELKEQDFVEARRYIYDELPVEIESIDARVIVEHLFKIEPAFNAFERIGYLIRKEYLNREPILENYWAPIWRCWNKSRHLILWARKERNQEDYLQNFEFMADIAETYRKWRGYQEPKFYPLGKTPSS